MKSDRFVKGEDAIIKKYWGTIPDWRMMMYDMTLLGYDRTLDQVQRRDVRMQKQGILPRRGHKEHSGIHIRCIETGEVFESMAQALRLYSPYTRNVSHIARAVRSGGGKAYGMHWETITDK